MGGLHSRRRGCLPSGRRGRRGVDTRSRTTFTFGELLDASRRVATGLRKLGLDTGDVVAFHGTNTCELVVAMCGTFFAGGIGMLNKSSLTVGEIYRQLVDAKAKYVFCELDKIAEMRQTCSRIDSVEVTTMGAYPAVIRQLDQWHQLEDFDTRSLTKILCGGGAVNPSILQSVRRKLKLKELSQVYGMTEMTSCIACSTHQDDIKSVGKPAPFVEMKVVDFHTRKLLGPNQQGEVCVKGPAAFKAYLNQPKATAETYEDGFFCTGDMGYYTEDGCFFLCGRFKELIKCMDQQVSPAELEELLAADPDVRHVVVAGVPHPKYGEAARAFVVHWRRLTDPLERQQEAERLERVIAGRLSHHKQLHGGVEFLDSIPLSEVGKDLRSALTKTYIERLQSAKDNRVE
ncbi:hypothetical protein HPB50_007207 [Hyalomma asiaticum]|uniref:Uncharacterized protein n=1 Tax=Hyalomma asiaticum TaxID=266040 RepID=A0ACB7TFS3_HYAAI|nr:hypothetical protein HPB50_007207 [Hyalomma asiaticum]